MLNALGIDLSKSSVTIQLSLLLAIVVLAAMSWNELQRIRQNITNSWDIAMMVQYEHALRQSGITIKEGTAYRIWRNSLSWENRRYLHQGADD